jgi:UDP:flavonoid glycosyltransferase YjiC (YdhE family)
LQEHEPDLIAADFAPTLRLASGGRIPTIVVGNGYTVPPGGRPLPPIRPWQASVPARSRQHEGELLAAVNAVRAQAGGACIDHFADLFHGESSFVCTLDEFDPYRSSRDTDPLWPFNVPAIPNGASSERDRLFAYFQSGHPALDAVLQALSVLGRRAEIYVQGADPRSIASRCPRHVGVHTKPADFAAILPRASLLIHHAGLGTAYSGLVAGVPQVVLPLNLEHAITTSGLEVFGAARRLAVKPVPDPKRLAEIFADVIDAGPEREAATVAQGTLAGRRDPVSVERVVAACNAQL